MTENNLTLKQIKQQDTQMAMLLNLGHIVTRLEKIVKEKRNE